MNMNMYMYEYDKMMLNRFEQVCSEPDDSRRDETYSMCAGCGCEELIDEMHEIHRENAQYAHVCFNCIDNFCDVDNALRFLAANELERDYFVRVYMNTDCNDSADNRIVNACKNAWFRKYFTRTVGDYSFEAETLLNYASENELWDDWAAAELLS